MHRWFFADDREVCEIYKEKTPSPSVSAQSVEHLDTSREIERRWKFCVKVPSELLPNESVGVTGSCNSLGSWQLDGCILLSPCENCPLIWNSFTLLIPKHKSTEYRYLIIGEDTDAEKFIVRRWETHIQPRVIPPQEVGSFSGICKDIFGQYQGVQKVDRGWLTCETLVQFVLSKAPFSWKHEKTPRLIYSKITPMNKNIEAECALQPVVGKQKNAFSFLDGVSSESDASLHRHKLSTAFAFNEVSELKENKSAIIAQSPWGVACGAEDVNEFFLTVGNFENTVFQIDLYIYSSKAAIDEPSYHYGYSLVHPHQLKNSRGSLKVPIFCATTHSPLGLIKLDFLVILPVKPSLTLDMRVSYTRYWNLELVGVEAGHRGCGVSFTENEIVVRENTIYSMKRAANAGADMIEFDVQLSKDNVPVIYHDFQLHVATRAEEPLHKSEFNKVPVSSFTLTELQSLRVSTFGEHYFWEHHCPAKGEEHEHLPFPTLEEVFDVVDPSVAFDIEVKWAQQLENNTMEEMYTNRINPNKYLDNILQVVLRKANGRRIFFSCFDVDICTMLRFKQNRYPTLLLTMGNEPNEPRFSDVRCQSFDMCVNVARAHELLGLVTPSRELIEQPTQMFLIKTAKLVLFCWGKANKDMRTIQMQIDMGVNGIIYDRIDVLLGKGYSRSIFTKRDNNDKEQLICWPQTLKKKLFRINTELSHNN